MQEPSSSRASELRHLLGSIDRLLRGKFTEPETLRHGRLDLPIKSLIVVCAVLGMTYGVLMGLYAMLSRGGVDAVLQALASAIKVPLLFLLTLGVTFPSLYVFSALARSRLGWADTLRLLLAGVAVNLAVLASFGPVAAFFTLSTDSYPFMVVLHVAFFGVSGLLGVGFVRSALTAIFTAPATEAASSSISDEVEADRSMDEPLGDEVAADPSPGDGSPAATRQAAHQARVQSEVAGRVMNTWLVIYGIVGAQMGWILRPFVGAPDREFEWFRARESNFFAAIIEKLGELLR